MCTRRVIVLVDTSSERERERERAAQKVYAGIALALHLLAPRFEPNPPPQPLLSQHSPAGRPRPRTCTTPVTPRHLL